MLTRMSESHGTFPGDGEKCNPGSVILKGLRHAKVNFVEVQYAVYAAV